MDDKSNKMYLKEVVKTTALEHDSPNHKIDGGLLPQKKKGRKIDREFIFSIFIREQHEDSIKQIKKICHIHFKDGVFIA